MEKKQIVTIRIILTLLTIGCLAWIFSNSLATGTESSNASQTVTETVQDVVGAVAPSSPIATATGEEFDLLHTFVRNAGHFCQFALLGALLFWCLLSYSLKKKALWIAPVTTTAIAFIDEYLQTFVEERVGEIFDVFLDCAGAVTGIAFAVACVWLGIKIISKRKKNVGA
jgi:VanZ family protein